MSFEFGIASGDITATSAVLWTRLRPGATVGWQVERRDDATGRRHGVATADGDGFVHIPVADLTPGTAWRYQLFETEGANDGAGARSAPAHFRTLPESGRTRFAVVSCAKYNSGFFNAYDAIADRDDLDFVLHLGDYIYEAAQVPRGRQTPGIDIGRPFDPPHDCVTRSDYDRRYAQYRRDPAVRRLHEAHGLVFTLDDHEIADNAWSGGAEEHRVEDGPWDVRLRNALTAWESWQPTMRAPSSGGDVWQVLPIGDVATLVLCDARLHRTDPHAADGPHKSVLGAAQVAALEQAARDGDGWLIAGMPSKLFSLAPARGDADADLLLTTLKLSDPDGKPYHDRWDAFATERDGILARLEESQRRTVLLCGDVHVAAFSQTPSRRVAECVTTSVTSPNFDDKMGWPANSTSRHYEARLVERVPDLEWCDVDRHGYLIVDVAADRFSCEWWGVRTIVERSSDAELLHRVELS